jgi:hypothetical protein
MRFRKAMVLVNFLTVCFMLVSQSAKADTVDPLAHNIIINDLGGTVVVQDNMPGRVGPSAIAGFQTCGALNLETCAISLLAPAGGPTPFAPIGASIIPATYLLSEPGTVNVPLSCTGGAIQSLGCVSDGLNSTFVPGSILPPLISLKFSSDTTVNGQEFPNAPCPTVQSLTLVPGCNRDEDGTPQLVDVIKWSDGTIDNIYIQSDIAVGVEPEPASMILFGSGLVMAGGFLRRRRRVVTPSVPCL